MTAAAADHGAGRRFPALAHRDFRVLWVGLLLASGTMAFQYYAQLWLVYGMTRSALLLGLLGVTRGLAMLLLGLVGGALADRMDRRKLLIATETIALGVNCLIAVGAITGYLHLWQALALIFVGSAVASIEGPVRQALIPELVPREHIPNAVALTTAARMGTFAVTPVIAGFVIDRLGPGGAYGASLGGHAIVIAAVLMLHYRGRRLAGGASVIRSIGGGFTYVIAHREVFWIIAVTFITGALGMSIFHGIIAKWAAEVLQLAPGQYGQLASLWGIGTLVTAYTLAFVGHVPRKGSLFIWASVAFGASFLLFALTRSIPLAALAYLINGAAWTAANICAAGIVQGLVPNEVRGRVMSLFLMNGAAAQLSGLALGGIADLVGMPALMVGATAACTLSVLVLIALVPTLRHIDRLVAERTSAEQGAAAAREPTPVPSVAAARGPE